MEELKALTGSLVREMKANTAEVTLMRQEQQRVLEEHRALRRAHRRERFWRRAAVGFVVAAIAAVLITNQLRAQHEKKLSNGQAADLRCISAFENANRDRTIALTKLSGPRNAALAAAQTALGRLTTAAATGKVTAARGAALLADFNRKQAAFLKADAAYNKALVDNPVPSPVFNCSDRLKSTKAPKPAAAAAVVTATATPASAATRTRAVTVSVPTTVAMPGRTVTVPQTARTVVVTRVRTVTKTVSPPSCLPALKPPCVIGIPK